VCATIDINSYTDRFINVIIDINGYQYMAMKRILVSVSEELYEAVERERKSRRLETIPETARAILSEFFRDKMD
jgi:predicted RNA-binding protein Jag